MYTRSCLYPCPGLCVTVAMSISCHVSVWPWPCLSRVCVRVHVSVWPWPCPSRVCVRVHVSMRPGHVRPVSVTVSRLCVTVAMSVPCLCPCPRLYETGPCPSRVCNRFTSLCDRGHVRPVSVSVSMSVWPWPCLSRVCNRLTSLCDRGHVRPSVRAIN